MNYGFFDNKAGEYVILRPDTPTPWVNYLGSPEYAALISNNAGGYSFVKSGAKGRLLRYNFNSMDTPGRYLYIRDNSSEDYWSASWKPVRKNFKEASRDEAEALGVNGCGSADTDPGSFRTIVRHGTGYSRFITDYSGIRSVASYYVPSGKSYEVWELSVTNTSNETRELTLTGYAEFTNDPYYSNDMVNLQYTQFITRTFFHENRILQEVNGNLDVIAAENNVDDKQVKKRFFALAGESVSSYCGDRSDFLGNGHDYSDPTGVTSGKLSDTTNYNANSCGALSCVISLAPGETKTIAFLLGEQDNDAAADIVSSYNNVSAVCEREIDELRSEWHERFTGLQINTPSEDFNTMMNLWHAYNCFMTFIWSRAASFIYCGERNGYGYRDTVQDIQGIIHLRPDMAKDMIVFMLSAQVHHGGGLPLVKYTHNAGHEDTPEDESYVKETGHPAYRADDALWLFPTIYKYISETGDVAFLDQVIPFADKDEGTVYEHLKRAISFSDDHLGAHGMPAGLHADWNDCLRLGAKGESTFVAEQYYYALTILSRFADAKGDSSYKNELAEKQKKFGDLVQKLCWNEDRFLRGYKDTGERIGDRNDPEANMWLNPQSWGVISGLASPEQAGASMQQVYDRLNTDYGAILMDPPYHAHAFDGALAVLFNPGTKENAGIFSQSQGWLILAEALLGHGDRAFMYFSENNPAAQNDRAEIRTIEPYCFGQFTEGKASPNHGRSHVHWLTGTASTVMVGCVEGILGLRPDIGGLRIAPSIPSDWKEFGMDKRFRGKMLHIRVENPSGKQSGFSSMTLNGKLLDDNYIPADMLADDNDVVLVM
ncbi:MAG TPA: N,N'-diacetylchitobiose phosphorylase [Lachnospiraceae bacterium]|nr:N,N'-diacetylchitobiose phosphorylase [Lachnospiraceae bacterium]